MAKIPFFPLFAQDFDMDTNTWTNEEIGVYLRLLLSEWINGPLPDDTKKLAQIARISPKKFKNLFQICSPKFVQDGNGFLINKRMEKEREKVNKSLEQKRIAGIASAKKRWGNDNERYNDRYNGCYNERCNERCNKSESYIYNTPPTPPSSGGASVSKKKSKNPKKDFYPGWLDLDLWFDFVEYRKTIKAPLTDRAEKILLTELDKLINTKQGTQKGIIEQTIASCKWKGFYPVRSRGDPEPVIVPYKPPELPKECDRVSPEEIRETRRMLRKGGLKQ